MASFLSKSFAHKGYAAFRPTYAAELYRTALAYHEGSYDSRRSFSADLGTGHGLATRELSPHFHRVIGTNPSAGMVSQAREMSPVTSCPNVEFHQSAADSLPFLKGPTVDLVTAAQTAYWFDYARLWPELARIVRPRGTLTLWGYKDHVLVSHPHASAIIRHFTYAQDPDLLGSYWQQPGRGIVQDKLRAVEPPLTEWAEIQRIEYEPATTGVKRGQGTYFTGAKVTLGTMEEYTRTWGSFHQWQQRFPSAHRRGPYGDGEGDVIDQMMDAIRRAEPAFQVSKRKEKEDDVKWESALIGETRSVEIML